MELSTVAWSLNCVVLFGNLASYWIIWFKVSSFVLGYSYESLCGGNRHNKSTINVIYEFYHLFDDAFISGEFNDYLELS